MSLLLLFNQQDTPAITGDFVADAVLRKTASATFTADAVIAIEVLLDLFDRTLTNELGSPNIGQPYVIHRRSGLDEVSGNFTVNGDRLVFTGPAGDKFLNIYNVIVPEYGLFELDIYWDELPVGQINFQPPSMTVDFAADIDLDGEFVALILGGQFSDSVEGQSAEVFRFKWVHDPANDIQRGKIWGPAFEPEPPFNEHEIVSGPNDWPAPITFWASPSNVGFEIARLSIKSFSNDWTFWGAALADAILLKTISSSFTADSVLEEAEFTTGSFTANAVLKTTVQGTLVADSNILSTVDSSFTADSILKRTVEDSGAPEFVNVGPVYYSLSGPEPAYPSGLVVGNLILANITTKTSGTHTTLATAPAGWEVIRNDYLDFGGAGRQRLITFAHWVDGTEGATQSFPMPADHLVSTNGAMSFMAQFSNVGGRPGTPKIESSNVKIGTAYPVSPQPIITTNPNRLAVVTNAHGDDNSFPNNSFGGMTKRFHQQGNALNNDLVMLLHTAPLPDAGTFTAGAQTFAHQYIISSFALASGREFTANAVLKGTTSGSLTADAVIHQVLEVAFTADAYLAVNAIEATFTADAVTLVPVSAIFTADAYLVSAVGADFTADAVVKRTESVSFTANAYLVGEVVGSFTADAVLQRSEGASFTANAYLISVVSTTFTANAVIRRTEAGQFTANATLRAVVTTSFTADAIVVRTESGSVTADAIIRRVGTVTLTADAVLRDTEAVSFTADAFILKTVAGTFTSDAALIGTFSYTFTANALIVAIENETFTADAVISGGAVAQFTADAVVKGTLSGEFSAGAVLLGTETGSFAASAILRDTEAGLFTADAYIRIVVAAQITADAIIDATQAAQFTADSALVAEVNRDFTADAYLLSAIADSFTADAILLVAGEFDFTVDAIILRSEMQAFTADSRFVPRTVRVRPVAIAPRGQRVLRPGTVGTRLGTGSQGPVVRPQRHHIIKPRN